ncbi:MAG: hypothetical protein HKN29_04030 [Rhodothermales bacterium]|nr:hypothetical protein [Rhodothermales bacterium]
MHLISRSLPLLLGAVLLVVLSACESSVAPRADTDRHFSLYGVVSPDADSQGVLVFPIENELRELPAEPIDAILTSTDLETGEELVWSDSLVFREDGVVHVYWAPFRAIHDRSYQLSVRSADGDRRAAVTVKVPPEAEIAPGLVREDIWILQDVAITAPVERLNFLQVRYFVKAKVPPAALAYPVLLPDKQTSLGAPPPPTDPQAPLPPTDSLIVQQFIVPVDYSNDSFLDASGWTIPINFSFDFTDIRQRVARVAQPDPTYGIRLEHIEITLVAANAEWAAPQNVYDPEVLIQPGTMTNVQGGFGFVGAGYRLSHTYNLPDATLTRIGFRLDND